MRTHLINEIKELLNPSPKNIEVFYPEDRMSDLPKEKQRYKWNGQVLTYAEANKIPAKMSIFVLYTKTPIPNFQR